MIVKGWDNVTKKMYRSEELNEMKISISAVTGKCIDENGNEMVDIFPLIRSMSCDKKGNNLYVGDRVKINKKICIVRYGQYKLKGQIFEGFYLDGRTVNFNIHTSRIGTLIGNVFEIEQQ